MNKSISDMQNTVYVGGLSEEVTDEILYTVFVPFGTF